MNNPEKKLSPERISLWLNVIGFVLSLIFYIRMDYRNHHLPEPLPPQPNALHDSALVLQTELRVKLMALKHTQDSVRSVLKAAQSRYDRDQGRIREARQNLKLTLSKDWQNLNQSEKEAYLNRVFTQFPVSQP